MKNINFWQGETFDVCLAKGSEVQGIFNALYNSDRDLSPLYADDPDCVPDRIYGVVIDNAEDNYWVVSRKVAATYCRCARCSNDGTNDCRVCDGFSHFDRKPVIKKEVLKYE